METKEQETSIWILTSEINSYYQEGAYFKKAWCHKPTLSELSKYFYENERIESLNDEQILFLTHVYRGGGRQDFGDEWFNLFEAGSD